MPPVSFPANAAPTITDEQVIPASADMDEDQMQIPWFDKVMTALANETHSPAMVKHGMNIIQQITVRVNPGQIPVLTVDQPLYAIASGHGQIRMGKDDMLY